MVAPGGIVGGFVRGCPPLRTVVASLVHAFVKVKSGSH